MTAERAIADTWAVPATTVSVVICVYTEDRWAQIQAAVGSVRRQSLPAYETIVVVDHNDALLARCAAEFGDHARVLPNAQHQGLSGARNTGVAEARGDVVAFLDDDATARRDWLEELVRDYDDPLVMGTGGRAVPVWPNHGPRPRWLPEAFDWVVGCSFTGQPEEPAEIRNFLGANMSFRRRAFEIAGDFDHSVGRVGTRPVGCEETEFCIRLRQLQPGARLRYLPAAVVHHEVAPGRTRWAYFRSRCYSEGLSKAVVSRLVGADDGLATERGYVLGVLPREVLASVRDAVATRDPRVLVRGLNVVVGLAVTTAGYLVGRRRSRSTRRRPVRTAGSV